MTLISMMGALPASVWRRNAADPYQYMSTNNYLDRVEKKAKARFCANDFKQYLRKLMAWKYDIGDGLAKRLLWLIKNQSLSEGVGLKPIAVC